MAAQTLPVSTVNTWKVNEDDGIQHSQAHTYMHAFIISACVLVWRLFKEGTWHSVNIIIWDKESFNRNAAELLLSSPLLMRFHKFMFVFPGTWMTLYESSVPPHAQVLLWPKVYLSNVCVACYSKTASLNTLDNDKLCAYVCVVFSSAQINMVTCGAHQLRCCDACSSISPPTLPNASKWWTCTCINPTWMNCALVTMWVKGEPRSFI